MLPRPGAHPSSGPRASTRAAAGKIIRMSRRSKREFAISAMVILSAGLLCTAFIGAHDLLALALLGVVVVAYIDWIDYWRLRSRREKRRVKGLCEHCGYNLTGNTSGTCPECGTPVAGKAAVKA